MPLQLECLFHNRLHVKTKRDLRQNSVSKLRCSKQQQHTQGINMSSELLFLISNSAALPLLSTPIKRPRPSRWSMRESGCSFSVYHHNQRQGTKMIPHCCVRRAVAHLRYHLVLVDDASVRAAVVEQEYRACRHQNDTIQRSRRVTTVWAEILCRQQLLV